MGTGTAATVSRVVALAAGVLVVSATISLAATSNTTSRPKPTVTPKQRVLVVPDVRRQVFVFAKGTLEDSGFGWLVTGSTRGFAANRVASQSPAPGTRLVDTGAPKITLQLERTSGYAEIGTPEDVSPYGASLVRRTAAAIARAKAAAARKATAAAAAKARAEARNRTPAFAVVGAPRESLGQQSLPARAAALAVWIGRHRTPSAKNNRHWLNEHAWIVTGAQFGWWGGAHALTTLVETDRLAEKYWRAGTRNRLIAQQALREVQAKSKQA